MNILIVDDSKAMRMIVRRTLREAGYAGHELKEAGNGVGALEAIKSESFDLILSDWNMPEMSGLELLQKLKNDGTQVKFGFVTSESSAEMKVKAIEEGALFLITKPFTAETFRSALQPILNC
ncbi:MAG: response regulator [Terriglobales bacterium]|jgi:two-component system chemotaxis response regulator CheY